MVSSKSCKGISSLTWRSFSSSSNIDVPSDVSHSSCSLLLCLGGIFCPFLGTLSALPITVGLSCLPLWVCLKKWLELAMSNTGGFSHRHHSSSLPAAKPCHLHLAKGSKIFSTQFLIQLFLYLGICRFYYTGTQFAHAHFWKTTYIRKKPRMK